jgi:hypothetical protein
VISAVPKITNKGYHDRPTIFSDKNPENNFRSTFAQTVASAWALIQTYILSPLLRAFVCLSQLAVLDQVHLHVTLFVLQQKCNQYASLGRLLAGYHIP